MDFFYQKIIENKGTLTISNGTVETSTTYAALDNDTTGTMIITGGRYIATGGKGALYNKGGIVEISGDAYFYSEATSNVDGIRRGTVQNNRRNYNYNRWNNSRKKCKCSIK